MKCSIRWILISALCVFVSGCKSEDPNPELLDPIYKDLLATTAAHEKSFEEAKAHKAELEISIAKGEPNSLDLAKMRIDMAKTLRSLQDAEQKARYFRIRAARRRVDARAEYKKAFHAGTQWPDPHEYSQYEVNKRLQEVNLNWNARVPKLADRTSASAAKAPPKPAAGGGGGH